MSAAKLSTWRAKENGYAAYLAAGGENLTTNPYAPGSACYKAWTRGWMSAASIKRSTQPCIADGCKGTAARSLVPGFCAGCHVTLSMSSDGATPCPKPSARELKAVGGVLHVGIFKIRYRNNWGDDRFPWVLCRTYIVGSKGADESSLEEETFPTLREAVWEAKKRARAAIAKARGES